MGREDEPGGDLMLRRTALAMHLIKPEMKRIITRVSIMMMHLMKK